MYRRIAVVCTSMYMGIVISPSLLKSLWFLDHSSAFVKEPSIHLEFAAEDAENGNVLPMHLVFTNISVKRGEKFLLKNVSGEVRPGEVLALMGPSGRSDLMLIRASVFDYGTFNCSNIILNNSSFN